MYYYFSGTIINVTFDNMGGNSALGFAESMAASYFCRTCLSTKEETQSLTVDVPEKYRTRDSYDEAIRIIQNSSEIEYKITKGIREYCILNDLTYFNILDNFNVDIMHDLCEGTIQVLLHNVFNFCVREKLLSESGLKSLVAYHDYGILNRHNLPSELKLERKNLNQNASQTKCILHHLPFILFDYKLDTLSKDVRDCIQSMLKIVSICYSSKIGETDLKELEHWVKIHLDNMIEVFGINLKPKHHFMIHYANIIRKVGPLVHMSTLRFETKHKEFTKIAKSTNNYRNINKTLGIRYQESLLCRSYYVDQTEHGKLKLPECDFFTQFGHLLYDFKNKTDILQIRYLKINSHYYESGLFVKNGKFLFQILKLFKYENDYYFICNQFDVVLYNAFLNSIQIERTYPDEMSIFCHSKLSIKKSFEKKNVLNNGNVTTFLLVESLDILSEE